VQTPRVSHWAGVGAGAGEEEGRAAVAPGRSAEADLALGGPASRARASRPGSARGEAAWARGTGRTAAHGKEGSGQGRG